jgi:hypothetical protein
MAVLLLIIIINISKLHLRTRLILPYRKVEGLSGHQKKKKTNDLYRGCISTGRSAVPTIESEARIYIYIYRKKACVRHLDFNGKPTRKKEIQL